MVTSQVSENGAISFEKDWRYAQPEQFPTSNPNIQVVDVVAPYWSDNDIRKEGVVRYVAINKDESTEGDNILADIDQHLHDRGTQGFTSTFAIIAQWDHVHPFPHASPSGYNISEAELNKVYTKSAHLLLIYTDRWYIVIIQPSLH